MIENGGLLGGILLARGHAALPVSFADDVETKADKISSNSNENDRDRDRKEKRSRRTRSRSPSRQVLLGLLAGAHTCKLLPRVCQQNSSMILP